MKGQTLVLGLGNLLMGDEGIGVKSIEYMQDFDFQEHVRLLDGGTGGFHLLSLFKEYTRFIIIDATLGGDNIGDIQVLKPKFASDFPRSLTSHDIGLRDLMQSAELIGDLPEIYLITINISEFNKVRIGLSEHLEKCLPAIHQKVNDVLEEMARAQSRK